MIGISISTRKPRSDDQSTYTSLQHPEQYLYQTPDGITIHIQNTTGKPIYIKWRI